MCAHLSSCIKLKTNAVLIREAQAARLRDLGVESIQVSIYSHRPEVHDAITKVPGSLRRSINAIRFLKSQGLKVIIANVLMTENCRTIRASGGWRMNLAPSVLGSDGHADDGRRSRDPRFECRRVCTVPAF